jgi:hypothetical protein
MSIFSPKWMTRLVRRLSGLAMPERTRAERNPGSGRCIATTSACISRPPRGLPGSDGPSGRET